MVSPAKSISERIRQQLSASPVDFAAHPETAHEMIRQEIGNLDASSWGASGQSQLDHIFAEAHAELTGLGKLQPLLDDPEIEEIWINAPSRVFVAKNGKAELTSLILSETELRDAVDRMLHLAGRRVDLSTPMVDASLPNGYRVHVAIPDITRNNISVNIRKFSTSIQGLNHLVDRGALTAQAAEFLRMSVLSGLNILVSGPTHSGKTTLLRSLLHSVRAQERIITVEETFELNLQSADVVALQCRQPTLEGKGEITLRQLVKETLRMRPDRIVVGEVREAESLDLLIALNSGVFGMCSIHANTAADALLKLGTLPLLAGKNIDANFIVPTIASCIDLVVHCAIDQRGRRFIQEIAMPEQKAIGLELPVVTVYSGDFGLLSLQNRKLPRMRKFEQAGMDPNIIFGASVPAGGSVRVSASDALEDSGA
ncbi:MAG: ATPase, T2SS/T4P/T4SS family [Microbacteriaceae bacterium]